MTESITTDEQLKELPEAAREELERQKAQFDRTKKRHEVAERLTRFSKGTFEHWLGEALFRADLTNQYRIEREFAFYWDMPDELPDEEEIKKVVVMMIRFGGHFASNLGEALKRANFEQVMRIKKTWPELWHQYVEMANSRPDLLD